MEKAWPVASEPGVGRTEGAERSPLTPPQPEVCLVQVPGPPSTGVPAPPILLPRRSSVCSGPEPEEGLAPRRLCGPPSLSHGFRSGQPGPFAAVSPLPILRGFLDPCVLASPLPSPGVPRVGGILASPTAPQLQEPCPGCWALGNRVTSAAPPITTTSTERDIH